MNFNETLWDKRLKIHTAGRDDSHADRFHYPYEPTPYSVLERLAQSGLIGRNNILVDYGCGKGRVGFFMAHRLGCRVIGIEYDRRIFEQAEKNRSAAVKTAGISFICTKAEEYRVEQADCFYFFNPFSVEILCSVVKRIMESYLEAPRSMKLFFYYPNDDYCRWLEQNERMVKLAEIGCGDLFCENDPREKIMVYEIK